jgi:hypothetical protein
LWNLESSGPKVSDVPQVVAIEAFDETHFLLLKENELGLMRYEDIGSAKATAPLATKGLSLSLFSREQAVVGTADGKLVFFQVGSTGITKLTDDVQLDVIPGKIKADGRGLFVVAADPKKIVVFNRKEARQTEIPVYFFTEKFEVSSQKHLLLIRGPELIGFDLERKDSHPVYNHGGLINALAISPHNDLLAVSNGNNIFLRDDSRNYAARETWLNGAMSIQSMFE